MKTHLLIVLTCWLNIVIAQDNPTPKSSASIRVVSADDPESKIKLAKAAIQDLTKWLEYYEWELNESNKNTGVSPGVGRTSNLNMSKRNRSASGDTLYNSRNSLKDLAMSLDQFEKSNMDNQRRSLSDLQQAQKALDKSIESLYKSIVERGDYNVQKAEELKIKHDTVKNSINNIR